MSPQQLRGVNAVLDVLSARSNTCLSQLRQKEQVEVIKKSLQIIGGRYVASYVYNSNLSQLQENKVPCTRMMNSLEVKLKKHGLVEQFNYQVKDFFNRGVLSWVSDIPGLEEMQKSFIPLKMIL